MSIFPRFIQFEGLTKYVHKVQASKLTEFSYSHHESSRHFFVFLDLVYFMGNFGSREISFIFREISTIPINQHLPPHISNTSLPI